jgi:hypothetical protein
MIFGKDTPQSRLGQSQVYQQRPVTLGLSGSAAKAQDRRGIRFWNLSFPKIPSARIRANRDKR